MTRFISALLLTVLALAGVARAEPSEAQRAARWADLEHAIFGDRMVENAGDRVAIEAPARAEDAATVAVAIRVAATFAPEVRELYLVIDDNPSPLAAHFVLGPLADAQEIATRVRIDDYTYLHAVAETADGRLFDRPIAKDRVFEGGPARGALGLAWLGAGDPGEHKNSQQRGGYESGHSHSSSL